MHEQYQATGSLLQNPIDHLTERYNLVDYPKVSASKDPLYFALLAAGYAANVAGGRPSHVLAAATGRTVTLTKQHVMKARRLGFLTPVGQNTASAQGTLTPAGRKVLEECD